MPTPTPGSQRNGFTIEAALDDDLQHHRSDLVEPTRLLADGERVGRLRAVWTPGHTPGPPVLRRRR